MIRLRHGFVSLDYMERLIVVAIPLVGAATTFPICLRVARARGVAVGPLGSVGLFAADVLAWAAAIGACYGVLRLTEWWSSRHQRDCPATTSHRPPASRHQRRSRMPETPATRNGRSRGLRRRRG